MLDDDLHLGRAIAHVLHDVAETIVATSCAEARKHYSSACGYLFDECLPDGSGLELLAEIRRHGLWRPAMILTGGHPGDGPNRAYDLAAHYYLPAFATTGRVHEMTRWAWGDANATVD